jgi:hypothetical protein
VQFGTQLHGLLRQGIPQAGRTAIVEADPGKRQKPQYASGADFAVSLSL